MNKAQQFRAEMEKAEQLKKEQWIAEKLQAEQERAAQKAKDLPLDLELADWLIANRQRELLNGKHGECKIVLGGDGERYIPFDNRNDAPKSICSHHLNNDNLDEVAVHLRGDGFTVNKKWTPAWESNDPDYRVSGGDCHCLEVSW